MATATSTWGPLSSTTNNSNSPPPSPPSSLSQAAKADPANQSRVGPSSKSPPLRRKTTTQNLVNLDSSETYPSPHSSLYEASIEPGHAFIDNTVEDAWVHDKDNADTPAWANTVCNTNGDPVPVSFLLPITPPKTHTPHKLYPITEQPSFTTLHPSSRTSSLIYRPSNLSLLSRRSRSPGLNGKRQKSFSLSDLPRLPDADLLPAADLSPPVTIRLVAQPNRPLQPPPVRSSTPPNLPRFGTPEACNYRLPRPARTTDKKKKKKKKKKQQQSRSPSSTPDVREWRRQTVGLPKNVIMRGDDGTLVKGKFVPTQSGHNGPMRRLDRGGSGNGQGHVPNTLYILPDVRPAQYSDHGTRATWTDAVMTGGIGAGPGVDPRYTPSVLQAQRDQTKRDRKRRRKENFEAWKAFFGLEMKGAVTNESKISCCKCSKRMWSCCPCVEESDGEVIIRAIPLQGGA